MTKARDIADAIINTAELADNAVTNAKMADDSVGSAELVDNSVGAAAFNISGNGTSGQVIVSDGDGSFSYANQADPFQPTTISGTTQTMDLSSDNFFDGGTHSANTTLAFSNVPTAKLWSYVYTSGTVTTLHNPLNLTADKSVNVSSHSSPVKGLGILSNGTKLFTAKSAGGASERVAEFTLSTAYDISTASYVREFNVTSNVGTLSSFAISPDGAKFYITHVDFPASKISEFTCSTPGDLSTASHTHTATITTNTTYNVGGLSFSADGTKFYISDANGGSSGSPAAQVDRYDLSSAFTLSTLSYSQSLDTSAYNYFQGGVAINDDGTKLLVGALTLAILILAYIYGHLELLMIYQQLVILQI